MKKRRKPAVVFCEGWLEARLAYAERLYKKLPKELRESGALARVASVRRKRMKKGGGA